MESQMKAFDFREIAAMQIETWNACYIEDTWTLLTPRWMLLKQWLNCGCVVGKEDVRRRLIFLKDLY